MNKKQIKKLAYASYTNFNLDSNKVKRIIKSLTRLQLKHYIKYLKNIENNNRVTIFLAKTLGQKNLLKELKKIFPNKKIILKEDKSLIGGTKIIVRDDVYDFSFKDALANLVTHVNQ